MGAFDYSNYSNTDIKSLIKTMGQSAAQQFLTNELGITGNYLSMVISGQMSVEDAIKACGSQAVGSIANSIWTEVVGAISKAAKAETDVAKTSSDIVAGARRAKAIEESTNQEVQAILAEISAKTATFQNLISKVEELSGDKGAIAEMRAQLEAKQKEIDEQKEILNDPAADKEKKEQALEAIKGISVEISTLITNVLALAKQTDDLRSEADETASAIDEQMTEGENVIAKNLQALNAEVTRTETGAIKDITVQKAKGAAEETEGAALTAAAAAQEGAAVFTFGITAASGAATEAKAADFLTAGHTHIAGSAINMISVGTAMKEMGGDIAAVANDMVLIGSAGTTAAAVIGDFDFKLAGAITSIGTWNEIELDDLNSTVEEYDEKLKEIPDETEEESTEEVDENDEGEQSELKKLKFEFDSGSLSSSLE